MSAHFVQPIWLHGGPFLILSYAVVTPLCPESIRTVLHDVLIGDEQTLNKNVFTGDEPLNKSVATCILVVLRNCKALQKST